MSDNCRDSLDRVVDVLVEAREQHQICQVPAIFQATHLLVVAKDDAEVQDVLWRLAKLSFLANLPVVVLFTDYLDVCKVCLDTALSVVVCYVDLELHIIEFSII